MRKYHIKPKLWLVAGGIFILMSMLFFSTKPGYDTCTAKRECAPPKPNLKGSDLILESISRQFISSVSF